MKKKTTAETDQQLGPALDRLAAQMVNEALSASVPLNVRIDIFKAVSQHHVNTTKVKPKGLPPTGGAATMDGLRNRISAATGQAEETSNDEEDDEE